MFFVWPGNYLVVIVDRHRNQTRIGRSMATPEWPEWDRNGRILLFCAGQAKRTASPLTPALSPSEGERAGVRGQPRRTCQVSSHSIFPSPAVMGWPTPCIDDSPGLRAKVPRDLVSSRSGAGGRVALRLRVGNGPGAVAGVQTRHAIQRSTRVQCA